MKNAAVKKATISPTTMKTRSKKRRRKNTQSSPTTKPMQRKKQKSLHQIPFPSQSNHLPPPLMSPHPQFLLHLNTSPANGSSSKPKNHNLSFPSPPSSCPK